MDGSTGDPKEITKFKEDMKLNKHIIDYVYIEQFRQNKVNIAKISVSPMIFEFDVRPE